jgi:hypothetical protein
MNVGVVTILLFEWHILDTLGVATLVFDLNYHSRCRSCYIHHILDWRCWLCYTTLFCLN